jgi:hypothetical protein
MPDLTTDYPNLRQNLNASYARVSDKRIEAILERNNIDAEAMEGFLDGLSKFASGAGKALLQAAPTILPIAGTIAGTAFGGPIGAQIGGSLGSLAGQAIGGATGQAPPPSQPAGGAQAPAASPLMGALGALPGIMGSPAAGQLLQTILRPETLQALASMALGPAGKPDVAVGGTPVPVGAFGSLLKMLAGRTEAEYVATRSGVPEYMQDFAGGLKGDPAVAAHRAEALYEMLRSADSEQESAEASEGAESETESESEAFGAEYEAMELMEAYESEAA